MSESYVLTLTAPEGLDGLDVNALTSTETMEVIFACKGCKKKTSLEVEGAAVETLTLASLAPAPGGDHTILRFSNRGDAQSWLDQHKGGLVGATVTLFDPTK